MQPLRAERLPAQCFLPSDHSYGELSLYGECRNTTNQHDDGKTSGTDITAALQAH